MNDIEKQMIDGLRNGSVDDFNSLYSIYADSLYSFSFKMLKSKSEAQDIVQDTFLKIWIKREQLSTELSFKAYLYTIAKNKILTIFQKKIKEILLEDLQNPIDDDQADGTDIEQHMICQDIRYRIYSSMARLPALQAKILIMKTAADLSTQEISSRLDIPHQTVKNNLTKAMKSVREELKRLRSILVIFHF